jgi:hypothetical protein
MERGIYGGVAQMVERLPRLRQQVGSSSLSFLSMHAARLTKVDIRGRTSESWPVKFRPAGGKRLKERRTRTSGKSSLRAMWGTDTQDAHLGNRYKVPAGSIPGFFTRFFML